MRVSIYARYSSDLQREASIEDQILICTERAAREKWMLVGTYADRGISGASNLRPGYQKLLDGARKGEFDVILVEALDRISRDQEHIAAFFKLIELRRRSHRDACGRRNHRAPCRLEGHDERAVPQGPRRQDAARAARTRRKGALRRRALLRLYDLPKRKRRARRSRDGRSRGDGGSSRLCRLRRGKSPRLIAAELNRDGTPGPGGRPWNDTTIRGHALRGTGLLHNELYIGRLVWNRLRYSKDPATGRRVSRINPREEWICRDVPDLRIVDDGLWDRAQARLAAIRNSDAIAKARATKFWTHRRPRHLLTDKAACGVCGGRASSIGKDYIACSTARRQGTCVNRASIRRSEIETWIIYALQRQLMAPDLVSEFVRAFNDEINKSRRDRDQRREVLMREEKELARRIDNLLDAVASGDLRGPTVQAKLEAFEERKLKASEERAGLSDEPVRLHPNLAAAYKAKVASLQTLLQQEATRAEAVEIIRSLIDQVILRPTAEGQLEIELVGDLANMVHLAQELDGGVPTRDAVRDEFARSIKVVAGAGFEPATFRL